MKIICTEKERRTLIQSINCYNIEKRLCEDMTLLSCKDCILNKIQWDIQLEPIDWSKVEVDTPILVSNDKDILHWYRRYFAKYENNEVYAWSDGTTSWTAEHKNNWTSWQFAKLAEKE